MRPCPTCLHPEREKIFSTPFTPPDGWTLPHEITWFTCDNCGTIYGDGNMTQAMLDEYYRTKYGYGINNPANTIRLYNDGIRISSDFPIQARVVDFGGAGDNGESVLIETLKKEGFTDARCVGVGDKLPLNCDVIYASHVLEHIYDLPDTMRLLESALAPDGLLIVDVPDATGLLNRWRMPILDFNTKHLNHFTLRTLLELGHRWGFESVKVVPYELEFAPCYQVHFKRLNVAVQSMLHIQGKIGERVRKLQAIDYPVNVWGMSDIVWVLLSQVDLNVLNYIDNDPAMRGATYKGKPIMERPDNNAPIVIMAQGQRERLINNIRAAGIVSEIIKI